MDVYADERALFAQVRCSSRLFMQPTVRRAGALASMPSAKADKRARR